MPVVKPIIPAVILLCLNLSAIAQEAPPFEDKITSVSPDKKFAMRIRHDKGIEQAEDIDSALIQAIDLVALPSKEVVAPLLPEDEIGMNFSGVRLVWSKDSKWCAFYYHFPRVGYTTVLHLQDGKFTPVGKPEDLMIDPGGDVRNEYIKPLRWAKPGTLVLEQFSIFRAKNDDDTSDAKFQLTATYDEKSGVFKITAQKEIK